MGYQEAARELRSSRAARRKEKEAPDTLHKLPGSNQGCVRYVRESVSGEELSEWVQMVRMQPLEVSLITGGIVSGNTNISPPQLYS